MRVSSYLGFKQPKEKAPPTVQGFWARPKENYPNNCPQRPAYFIGNWVWARTTRFLNLQGHSMPLLSK